MAVNGREILKLKQVHPRIIKMTKGLLKQINAFVKERYTFLKHHKANHPADNDLRRMRNTSRNSKHNV